MDSVMSTFDLLSAEHVVDGKGDDMRCSQDCGRRSVQVGGERDIVEQVM
jgi:hypothetical protein